MAIAADSHLRVATFLRPVHVTLAQNLMLLFYKLPLLIFTKQTNKQTKPRQEQGPLGPE